MTDDLFRCPLIEESEKGEMGLHSVDLSHPGVLFWKAKYDAQLNLNGVLGEQNQALRDELKEPKGRDECLLCDTLMRALLVAREELCGSVGTPSINEVARIDDAIRMYNQQKG